MFTEPRRRRRGAALVLALTLMLAPFTHIASAAPSEYSAAETAFIEWYEASPQNVAYYEWVVFMQDPANAAWFEWATTPKPQPQAYSAASGGSCGGWEGLIAQHFRDVSTACRVMLCESGGNPNALNPNTAYSAAGLFQIIKQWSTRYGQVTGVPYYDGRFDPAANVAFAAYLVNAEGWASQFDCY